MNADLDETLAEMGGEYRALVERLRTAPEAELPDGFRVRVPARRPLRMAAYLAAASLLAAFVLRAVVVAGLSGAASPRVASVSPSSDYALAYSAPSGAALDEILRRQEADGSWGCDFLTRQNAAALRGVPSAGIQYRRALRYLRSKGLSPLTDAELRERCATAARMVKWQTQRT